MTGSKDRRTGMNPILVALGQEVFKASAEIQGRKPIHTEELDKKGLVQCLECGRVYPPDLPYDDPNAKAFQKEQHISGICSDDCWGKLWG